MNKAAFLDRDGVINYDRGYVSRWDDFEFIPGVFEALKRLSDDGYLIIIITNQSGIARGYYTSDDYDKLTSQYITRLRFQGIEVTKVFHCPHYKYGSVPEFSYDCDCRKPQPGMIKKGELEFNLDLQQSVLFGDKMSDISAGNAAGVGRMFLVSPKRNYDYNSRKNFGCYANLLACVDSMLL